MFDKMKGKGMEAMIGPLMNSMQDAVSDINPENPVSEFIENNMEILFEPEEENAMLDGAAGLLKKLMVNEANQNFTYSLQKLLNFYESFRIFYKDLVEQANANKPTLLSEDDEKIEQALSDKEEEEENREDEVDDSSDRDDSEESEDEKETQTLGEYVNDTN